MMPAVSVLKRSPHTAISDARVGGVPRHLDVGDGLRATAALSILVFHAAIAALLWRLGPTAVSGEGTARQFEPIFGFLAPLFVNLRAGIYVFFALSGYLLTRSFLAAYLLDAPRPSIARYARNRALRIVPAFWVVTTVYLLWSQPWSAGAAGIAAVYGFAQNYYPTSAVSAAGPAWTLDLEVAFYVLIPVAFWLALRFNARPAAAKARLAVVVLALLAAYAGSLELKHLAGNPIKLTYNIGDYLFAFLPGVWLAAIEPFAAPRLAGARVGRGLAWGMVAASAVLLAGFVAMPVRNYGLRLIFVTLGCGALLAGPLVLQWSTGGSWRVLDNRPMRWLGERSYGIYLIHLGLMTHVLARFGHGHGPRTTFMLLLLGVSAVTILCADTLWRLVERPALERRLPWQKPQPAPRQRFTQAATVSDGSSRW